MLKRFKPCGQLSLLAFVLISCAPAPAAHVIPAEIPGLGENAFKGYELYSWEVSANHWAYALLIGTNALKTEAAISAKQQSQLQIVSALRALPFGAEITWNPLQNTQDSKTLRFGIPDESLTAELQKVIQERELKLNRPVS